MASESRVPKGWAKLASRGRKSHVPQSAGEGGGGAKGEHRRERRLEGGGRWRSLGRAGSWKRGGVVTKGGASGAMGGGLGEGPGDSHCWTGRRGGMGGALGSARSWTRSQLQMGNLVGGVAWAE